MWFPRPDEIFELHDRIIDRTGGERGVINPSAVHSAVERARWGPFEYEPDLHDRAAFILRGICQDHPFADGNKRTAYEASDTFLRRNGARIRATPSGVVGFMLEVARGDLDHTQIAAWLRARAENL